MNKWRLLDTGVRTADENMALDETLLESKSNGFSPNTVRLLQFYPPAVLVEYHQSIEQEVRINFCKQNAIDINRRIAGGGAIYFDETQLGWEVICEKSFFKVGIAEEVFFKNLCQPIIYGLQKLGIDYGKIKGEYRAIEIIKQYNPQVVVIVVLMPLLGTPMENVHPPAPETVAEIMAKTRVALPNVPLCLGCARKRDNFRIDVLAVDCGVNRIALDSPEATKRAEEYGLEIEFQKTCCSVPYLGGYNDKRKS